MEYKICSKCGENKAFDDYHKAIRGKFGLAAHCKTCEKVKYEKNKHNQLEKARQRYKENPEFFKEKAKKYAEGNKDSIAIKDSIRHKAKRLLNHEESLAKDKVYREANLDKIKEYKRNYAERNKDVLIERRKADYLENREDRIAKVIEWTRVNRSRSNVNKRRYAARNPDVVGKSRLRRRKIKMQCVPNWASSEWDQFVTKEIYHLSKLRTLVTGFVWHVDHKVPLVSNVVCGLHCADNLQTIPASVNLSKSNLYWDDMP